MPSIEEFNPAAYEPTPQAKKPGVAPLAAPQKPAAAEPGMVMRLLESIAQLPQTQAGLVTGATKELGRQVSNVARTPGANLVPGMPGSIAMLQRAILPEAQVQESFTPKPGAQGAGALAAKVGVPLLAGAATAGAATPLLAGTGTAARIGATAGLEGMTGAATGAAQGENVGEQALLGALLGGAGAGVGAAVGAGKAMAASRASKGRLPKELRKINEALGVTLQHTKEDQIPALAVQREGINLKVAPKLIEEQITLALDKTEQVKTALAKHLPDIPRAEVDAVLNEFGGPITKLVGKVATQVKKGELPLSTLDEIGDLQDLLTTPGDLPAIVADRARGNLRSLIERFAAGDKKKGIRKGLEDARKAIGDLTPALRDSNTHMADLIAARNAIRDKIAKLGVEGQPSIREQLGRLFQRVPVTGPTSATVRGVGRLMRD